MHPNPLKPVGKRYVEVADWLKKMSGTQIEVADQNYVWLSQWQLENLNSNYVLPIDLEYYRELTTPIAKAMVPLLYQWFYATSRRPVQKRYRELCQLLNIGIHSAISKAKEKIAPALDQLKSTGYLEVWDLVRTVDRKDFKLVITAGRIFDKELDMVLPRRDDIAPSEFDGIVEALVNRGVEEKTTRRLLLDVPDDYDAMSTIEWADEIVGRGRNITNPPGLYVSFLRDGLRPPTGFVTSKQRGQLKQVANARQAEDLARAALEAQYREYKDQQIMAYIKNLGADLSSKLLRDMDARAEEEYPFMTAGQRADVVERMVIEEAEPEVNLITFEEFESRQCGQLSLA